MTPDFFDNRSRILKDDMAQRLRSGDRISIAAAYFSIYGFQELRRELEACGELRFIYTEPTFLSAQAHPISPEEFLFAPIVVRKIKGGSVIYDRPNPDVDAGEQIPYWYAFLEPPQWFGCAPDDFRRVNNALFPEGAGELEVFEWTTDWSNYFDAGREWWGTACWSVYDRRLDRFAVLFASATD